MLNRRNFLALSSVVAVAGITITQPGFAQESDSELPVENASFIQDLSAVAVGTPFASPQASPEVGIDPAEVRGYIIGDPNAANTLQIYADYRCPHCRIFHTDIEPGLIEDFVKPGTMNLEILDFTVIGVSSFDNLEDDTIESVQAAEAAACAAEQDAYLQYRNWLYSGEPVTNNGDFSDGNLMAAAMDLGLDMNQFAGSLLNGVYEEGIIASVFLGLERGVRGTPSMILNNSEPFYVPQEGYPGLKEYLNTQLL